MITGSYREAAFECRLEAIKTNQHHGCLDSIYFEIQRWLNANFFVDGSKIAQCPEPLVSLRIICQNSADLSIPWKDFHWVETECAGISQSAGTSVFIHCTECLCRIFNDDEAMELGDATDCGHVAQPACIMHRQDSSRSGGDRRLDLRHVDVEIVANVDEDRGRTCHNHRIYSSDPRHGRNDHLIARADVMSTQRYVDGVGSGAHTNTELGAAIFGNAPLP